MAAGARRRRGWSRRQVLALAGAPFVLAVPAAGQQAGSILVVSRKHLLNDTKHARALLEAEKRLTAEIQARIDETKRALTAKEQELARLRSTLPRDEFEARTAAFDRRVRRERREAQRQAAVLQTVFRAERVQLEEALAGILEQVRAERGASVILNEEETMAADPAVDITDEVIARFNATVPPPDVPDLQTILSRARTIEEDGNGSGGQ